MSAGCAVGGVGGSGGGGWLVCFVISTFGADFQFDTIFHFFKTHHYSHIHTWHIHVYTSRNCTHDSPTTDRNFTFHILKIGWDDVLGSCGMA